METQNNNSQSPTPFEGPEKLLEVWFSPSTIQTNKSHPNGLLHIETETWQGMLDKVKCKILSELKGKNVNAYLLSESSMFVYPHKLILKTCGTTTLLLGIPTLLEISKSVGFNQIWRCFYSRKTFMFPEKQEEPHRTWDMEVRYLDQLFDNGSAYTVGPMNGDHWLLYLTSPSPFSSSLISSSPATPRTSFSLSRQPTTSSSKFTDYTLEILMTELPLSTCQQFFSSPLPSCITSSPEFQDAKPQTPHSLGAILSSSLNIHSIHPTDTHETSLDSYLFEPCGYSANGLIKKKFLKPVESEKRWEFVPERKKEPGPHDGVEAEGVVGKGVVNGINGHASLLETEEEEEEEDRYFSIHVTPFPSTHTYASFESSHSFDSPSSLVSLISRVLDIFKPGRICVTLFLGSDSEEDGEGEEIDLGKVRLDGYKRSERIKYGFDGYELFFGSWERVHKEDIGVNGTGEVEHVEEACNGVLGDENMQKREFEGSEDLPLLEEK